MHAGVWMTPEPSFLARGPGSFASTLCMLVYGTWTKPSCKRTWKSCKHLMHASVWMDLNQAFLQEDLEVLQAPYACWCMAPEPSLLARGPGSLASTLCMLVSEWTWTKLSCKTTWKSCKHLIYAGVWHLNQAFLQEDLEVLQAPDTTYFVNKSWKKYCGRSSTAVN